MRNDTILYCIWFKGKDDCQVLDACDSGGKEEPDFIETVCSWRNCNKEFSSQEALVKVRPIDINHGFWRRKIQRSTVY